MGTNVCLEFGASDAPAPVNAPVVEAVDMARVADALAAAAAALNAAADALRGANGASPSQSLTPPTIGRSSRRQLPSRAVLDPATVVEAINAFLVAKAGAGKSDRYLRAMKNSLTKFARGRAGALLGDITVEEIERWLSNSDWKGTTRRGYLRDVRTLYNFAMRRFLVGHNPASVVELPEASAGPIGIHTPEQVRTVLENARKHDLNVCRALAIRYFTGIRSSECDRLTEECIRTDTGFVEVVAKNAKTRRRRIIAIRPNLRAWLDLGGKLPLGDAGNRIRLFIKICGAPWPHNVTRHTFVSYSVASRGARKTALEAGHSEDMLFAHYRALVTPGMAAQFWTIVPA